MILSSGEFLQATRALACLTQAIQLQQYVDYQARLAPDAEPRADVEPLAAEADRLFRESHSFAQSAADICARHPKEAQAAYESLLGKQDGSSSVSLLTDDQRAVVRQLVEEQGGGDFVSFATANAARLVVARTPRSDTGSALFISVNGQVEAGPDGATWVVIVWMEVGGIIEEVGEAIGDAISAVGHWIAGIFS